MKKEDFYRKYANLPLEKRLVSWTFMKDGIAHSLTLSDIYKLICSQDEIIYQASREIDKWLENPMIINLLK